MSRTKWQPYLYLAPAAIILLAFSIYPVFQAAHMSVYTDWGKKSERFAGLRNYDALLSRGEFWHSLAVSVWYAVGTVPVALLLSFLIANLLFQKLRALGLYRVIYFLPYVTSTVAAAIVWRWIFDPNDRGIVNSVFNWLGLPAQRWYQEAAGVFTLIGEHFGLSLPSWAGGPSLALVCVMIFSIWHALGFDIVIFLAGLSAIPKEMHEAADIDGATAFQRLRHITLPLLSPTLFFLIVVSVIRSFQTFNQIYIMTPQESTGSAQNVTMLIFNKLWVDHQECMAAAVALLLFLIVLGLTTFQMRVLGPRVHY